MRKIFLGKCVCGFKTEELNTRSEVHHRMKEHTCTFTLDKGILETQEKTYHFCRHCGVGIVPQTSDLGVIMRWLNAIEPQEERKCFHRPGEERVVFEMEPKKEEPIPEGVP